MKITTNYSLPKSKPSFGTYVPARQVREFTNEVALSTIRKELSGKMPEFEAATWVKKLKNVCDHTGIEPKRLPINPQHPGNLTKVERGWILEGILSPFLS